MTEQFIETQELRRWLAQGSELAVLDPRGEEAFSRAHLFVAACAPLGRLETVLPDIVPRRGTTTVWCDDGSGLAERAATRARALGYADTWVLKGGIEAWAGAGYPLHSGVHVPSKALAEVVEHVEGTPSISAEELAAKQRSGEDFCLFDSRSFAEYQANSIPGAISVPGAELLYRATELVPSPETLVVVNCGGRTRSIIGAQSLINGGLPNRVVSLRNGTMAWHLAGLPIVKDQGRRPPEVSPLGIQTARERAAKLRQRFGIRETDEATLQGWAAERDRRSLSVLDVRTPEEYARAHRPGTVSAPGGQLVQETDYFVATLGARVVLVDEGTGLRAASTAAWLVQMGYWEVAVLRGGLGDGPLETGERPGAVAGWQDLDVGAVEFIAANSLAEALRSPDCLVIDVSLSRAHRRAHIPGARFALRARFASTLATVALPEHVVIVSEDGTLAAFAASELAQLRGRQVWVLDGGMRAWAAAGFATESGITDPFDEPDDVWYAPRDRQGDREAAMRDYLEWEVDLVNKVASDPDCRFRIGRSAAHA